MMIDVTEEELGSACAGMVAAFLRWAFKGEKWRMVSYPNLPTCCECGDWTAYGQDICDACVVRIMRERNEAAAAALLACAAERSLKETIDQLREERDKAREQRDQAVKVALKTGSTNELMQIRADHHEAMLDEARAEIERLQEALRQRPYRQTRRNDLLD